jgi:hypothetical protein
VVTREAERTELEPVGAEADRMYQSMLISTISETHRSPGGWSLNREVIGTAAMVPDPAQRLLAAALRIGVGASPGVGAGARLVVRDMAFNSARETDPPGSWRIAMFESVMRISRRQERPAF